MSIVYVILSKVEFLVGGFRLTILSFLVLIWIRMRIKTRISEYSNWQGPDFMGPVAYFCLSRTCFFSTKELAQNTKGIFVLQCLAIFAQFFLCLRVFHPIDQFILKMKLNRLGLSSAELELSLVLVWIGYYRAKDWSKSIYRPNSNWQANLLLAVMLSDAKFKLVRMGVWLGGW